jgi:ribonuclease D
MKPDCIATVAGLEQLTAEVAVARRVGLSLEDSSMRAYRPRVCLLALVLEGADGMRSGALVDVLALEAARESLRRLLIAPPRVVMHAAEHAAAALRRDFHLAIPGLSDTAAAATLLGLPQTGYRSLCGGLLGQTLAAAPSIDWRLRPLSEDAQAAAWQGAALLLDLHDALAPRVAAAELEEAWELASAEVAATRTRSNLTGPDSAWRLPEVRVLDASQQALLGAIIGWRDDLARERDCPPGQLIPNRELVLLARTPHESAARLADETRFHSRLMWPDREALRLILLGGGVTEPGEHGRPPKREREPMRPSPAMQARLRRLKAWRAEEAAARGVGLQAILPAAIMEHLARHGGAALSEPAASDVPPTEPGPRRPTTADARQEPATAHPTGGSVVASLGRDRMARYGDALARLLSGDP